MADLGIKIDTVAALRRPSEMNRPDPVAAALLAEMAGADAIVCRLQEDRRHIQDRDVELLRATLHSRMNLEMAATEEMLAIARGLLTNPDILIMDEPTSGLDPIQIIEIRRLIMDIGKTKTVFFSTHIMQEVEATL